jgi:hypothetical protein
MDFIGNLSEGPFREIFLSWTGLQSLGRFDSAMCNKLQRKSFTDMVTRPTFVVPCCYEPLGGKTREGQLDQFVSCAMQRGVAVAELSVTTSFTNHGNRIQYLQRNGSHVRKVIVKGFITLTASGVAAVRDVGAYCPNISSIDFNVSFVDLALAHLAGQSSNRRSKENRTDAALTALGDGCLHLTTVSLVRTEATDAGLQAVVRNGKVVNLCLEGSSNLTDQSLRVTAESSPLLETLNVYMCTSLTDVTLVAIGQHCHNLRELNVGETTLTHAGLSTIAAGCPQLEKLTASYCEGDIGTAIETIARGCAYLRSLDATSVDVPSAGVLALAECCPLLETLVVAGEEVGDVEITALARGCPLLQKLGIGGTSVSARGLRAIRDNCMRLQEIEVDESMYPGGVPDKAFFRPEVKVDAY